MKESYREGVANHLDPEPCGCGRKAAAEALYGGICRLGIELRNLGLREADGVGQSGRQQRCVRQREHVAVPAESKTPGMQRNSMCENREAPLPPQAEGRGAGGRTR